MIPQDLRLKTVMPPFPPAMSPASSQKYEHADRLYVLLKWNPGDFERNNQNNLSKRTRTTDQYPSNTCDRLAWPDCGFPPDFTRVS